MNRRGFLGRASSAIAAAAGIGSAKPANVEPPKPPPVVPADPPNYTFTDVVKMLKSAGILKVPDQPLTEPLIVPTSSQ